MLRERSMQLSNLSKTLLSAVVVLSAMYVGNSLAPGQSQSSPTAGAKRQACPNDDSGVQLPGGFCATIFADGIGHARHMVVAPSGVLYVNTWSGRYYGNDTPHAGGFLVALQDKKGAGKADVIERFGETVQSGGAGGTDIGSYKGSIYAESNDRIVRYLLPAGSIVPSGSADTIVSGLPLGAALPSIHFSSRPRARITSMAPSRRIPSKYKIRPSARPAAAPARNP